MQLKRNEEIINYPCANWTDENGTKWSRPTLAFMQARGFVEYVAPVVPPTLDEARAAAIAQIKTIRESALSVVVSSAGKNTVYDANAIAADAVHNGNGAIVEVYPGEFAQNFANNAGSKMYPAITGAQWAGYIRGEREREGLRMRMIENDKYIYYAYNLAVVATDVPTLQALPAAFQSEVDVILAAQTIEDLLLM